MRRQTAFAVGVLPDIHAFHRYTRSSVCPSRAQARPYPPQGQGWALAFHGGRAGPPADPLRPVNPNNARHPRVTAAAGTWLAVASFPGTVTIVPGDRGSRPEGLRPSRGIAPSGLRPLRKILDCSLPQESGQCLSPSVGDHPLRPPTRRRLGGPSPRRLANGTHARPSPAEAFPSMAMPPWMGMGYYPAFPPAVPRKGVGCIRVTHPCATLASPKGRLPSDLHVLGLPLAFILSQDQTLHCIIAVLFLFPV